MPRKRKPVRGLWEREPGSEIWWIRYRVDGVLKREKVGTHEAAKNLLNKRRNEIREGIKMPENMRQTSLRFKTLFESRVCRACGSADRPVSGAHASLRACGAGRSIYGISTTGER